MNEQQIRDWLLKNYLVDTDETRGMLDCIFAHDDTSHLEDRGEQLRAQRWGEDDEIEQDEDGVDFAMGMALTALVECHSGPHLVTCYSHVEAQRQWESNTEGANR